MMGSLETPTKPTGKKATHHLYAPPPPRPIFTPIALSSNTNPIEHESKTILKNYQHHPFLFAEPGPVYSSSQPSATQMQMQRQPDQQETLTPFSATHSVPNVHFKYPPPPSFGFTNRNTSSISSSSTIDPASNTKTIVSNRNPIIKSEPFGNESFMAASSTNSTSHLFVQRTPQKETSQNYSSTPFFNIQFQNNHTNNNSNNADISAPLRTQTSIYSSNPLLSTPSNQQKLKQNTDPNLPFVRIPADKRSAPSSNIPVKRSVTDLPPPTLSFKKLDQQRKNANSASGTTTSSSSSSNSISGGNVAGDPSLTYFTPQAKLAKPMPSAFHSTGLISKKNRPRQQNLVKPTPDTPAKKLNFHAWPRKDEEMTPSSSHSHRRHHSQQQQQEQFLLTSVKKKSSNRSPLQESPIKLANNIDNNFTPTRDSKKQGKLPQDLSAFKLSPLRYQKSAGVISLPFKLDKNLKENNEDIVPDENSLSPEDWSIRSRCVSTPETCFKSSNIFFSQNQPSPIKLSKHRSPTGRNMFDMSSIHRKSDSSQQPTPLRKTKQVSGLMSHQIYTPFPRFLTFEYLQQLRDPKGSSKESFSDDHIYPNYFETYFKIEEKLGEGSFSEAYRVSSNIDGMKYAIKKTKVQYQGHRDRMKKLEEVEMMYLVKVCKRCVEIISAWEQFGHLYIQMSLCSNGTLQKYVDDATRLLPMDEESIKGLLTELALGLQEIHERNIIHLDIKPANIFVDGCLLKYGDFGLATHQGVFKGEREGDRTYMAPELLGSNYNKPADIFSLGLIMLEICGNFVLPENGEYWQMLRNGNTDAVKFINVSESLIELVKSMIAPEPNKRPNIQSILSHPYLSEFISNKVVCEKEQDLMIMKDFERYGNQGSNPNDLMTDDDDHHLNKDNVFIQNSFTNDAPSTPFFSLSQDYGLRNPNNRFQAALSTPTSAAPSFASTNTHHTYSANNNNNNTNVLFSNLNVDSAQSSSSLSTLFNSDLMEMGD